MADTELLNWSIAVINILLEMFKETCQSIWGGAAEEDDGRYVGQGGGVWYGRRDQGTHTGEKHQPHPFTSTKGCICIHFTRQLHCSLKEQKACNLYLLEMFSSVKIMFIWIKGYNREYYPIGKFGTVHVYCMFSCMQIIVDTENMVDCIN